MSKKTQQQKEEQEQEQVWTDVFNLFDKDHNGHISKEELGHVFRALDMDPTQKELDAAVKELDKDGNGIIEYADFRAYMMKMKKSSYQERKQEMIRAFRMMDKNNDKYIDAHELMSVLTSLGEPLTKEEVEAMIRVADVNKDGKIDYEEFVEFILAPCLPTRQSTLSQRRSQSTASSLPSQQSKSQSTSSMASLSQSESTASYLPSQQNGSQTISSTTSQSSTGFFYTADTYSSASSFGYDKRSENESMTSLQGRGDNSSASMLNRVNFSMSEKDENDNDFLINQNEIEYQKTQAQPLNNNTTSMGSS